MRSVRSVQIASELDRDYEAVLDFRHDIQELCGGLVDLTLSNVCEADGIYVTAGEKGVQNEDKSLRERGLTKRGEKPSSQTNRQS